MDAFRNREHRADYWTTVSRWRMPGGGPKGGGNRGLRGESKVAWLYLYRLAGGVERSVVCHASSVAREIGGGERSARRALENLLEWGLISTPDRFKGEITVFLNDPLIVSKARLGSVANSGQGELEFPDDLSSPPEDRPGPTLPLRAAGGLGSPSTEQEAPARLPGNLPGPAAPIGRTGARTTADVVQHPPADLVQDPPPASSLHPKPTEKQGVMQTADVVQDPPKDIRHRHNSYARAPIDTSDIKTLCLSADLVQHPPPSALDRLRGKIPANDLRELERTQRQAQAENRAEVPTIAGVFGEVLRKLPTPAEQVDQANRYAAWIHERVADPSLYAGPVLRVAWAIVKGLVPAAEVHITLNRIDQNRSRGLLRGPPAAYFCGAMKRFFRKYGIPWEGKGKQP